MMTHLLSWSFMSFCRTVRSIWNLLMCRAKAMTYDVILVFIDAEIKFWTLNGKRENT